MLDETTKMTDGTATPEPKQAAPRPRWIVNHFGLCRKDRRGYARTVRLGNPGHTDVVRAKTLLNRAPANYAVRRTAVDNRTAYVFEPHYLAGLAAYRDEYQRALFAGEENIWVKASRAFVDKLAEMARPSTQPQAA